MDLKEKIATRLIVALSLVLGASAAYAKEPSWKEVREGLSRASDSQWRDSAGRSSVYYQLRFGSEEAAIADLNRQKAKAPFMEGKERLIDVAIRAGAQRMVQHLLARGETPNALTREEVSPLMIAAREGVLDIMRQLVRAGADVNYSSVYGSTAAHEALGASQIYAFPLLVDLGFDLQKARADTSANGLLFLAVQRDLADVIFVLVRSGFDINRPTADGTTPLHVAAAVSSEVTISMMLEMGADGCRRLRSGELPADLYNKRMLRENPGAPKDYVGPFQRVKCAAR